ncbi:MAG: ferredoxin reductase family protein [Gammaproteobacteria bacterium]|nr:ferredoxin reductase family protein [Gammaproteobacteria bacterium]
MVTIEPVMRIPRPVAIAAVLLALLPLMLAAPALAGSGWLYGLGRATGIAGMTCFLLAAILSVRIPGVDPWLGGLTTVWRLHHLLGAAAFLLLMAHPLLLALSAAALSPRAVGMMLWPPLDDYAVWAGWVALAAMMVFLAPSFGFFGPPRYQRWKRLHLLSGLALVLGVAHTLTLGRAITGAGGALLWGGLGVLAVAVFVYRAVLSNWIGPYRYRVANVSPLARGVVELTLSPESTPLHHRAGQFAYLRHFDPEVRPGFNEEHPYTLSSSPREDNVRIGIKALGDSSAAAARLHPGALVTLDGPYGRFFPPEAGDKAPQLWVGGGIGITPFVSRARDLGIRKPDCDVVLVYCANRPERGYYGQELQDIAASVPGFDVHIHYFNERELLDLDYLREVCRDLERRTVFVCGPAPMTGHVIRLMDRAGVPRHRIHTEVFDLL